MNNLNYIKVSLNGKITLNSPPYNRKCLKTFFLLAKPQLSKPKPNIPKLGLGNEEKEKQFGNYKYRFLTTNTVCHSRMLLAGGTLWVIYSLKLNFNSNIL